MLIVFNGTRENGNFMGDQLCYIKVAYLMVKNQPDVDNVIMSVSPDNEMHFIWERFLSDPCGDGSIPPVEVVYDTFSSGDWEQRWQAWDKWRKERRIEGREFQHYRELYLRIHGAQRQTVLCGFERGLGRKNIFEYVYFGQEHLPEECVGSDVYDVEINHPPLTNERDVWISPHAKTQGNLVFTFDFWHDVIHKLVDEEITVTVGFNGFFCEDLNGNPFYRKVFGNHKQWVEEVCRHKICVCGNTGTGWVAAVCKVPLLTGEPINSQMPDHRYRECGLKNIVEVVDTPNVEYVVKRIIEEVRRCIVMTTGCYDVIHAGHIRHLEQSRSMGTRLVVALNSDASVARLKGPDRPINPQNQRKAVLEALRCVDEVRVFDGDNALPLIQEIKPNVITNGFGYEINEVVGKTLVESWGGHAVITCQGDAKNEPSTTKIIQKIKQSTVVEACRAGAPYSVNPFEKLKLMADTFISVKDLQGDIADLGTYRGGAGLVLRRLAPNKHLHLFDTWEGTPIDDDLCHHKKGEWRASFDDCKKVIGMDSNTHYYPGVFPSIVASDESLGMATTNQFCFVYVDMDTYQATMDALKFFWTRLVEGGKILVDDYMWPPCAGVQKAVDEYFPPEECERYGNSVHALHGVAKRTVVEKLFTCILEKR